MSNAASNSLRAWADYFWPRLWRAHAWAMDEQCFPVRNNAALNHHLKTQGWDLIEQLGA